MKYAAQGESRVANIRSMRRSQVLYFSRDSHQELYTFIQTKWQCFKCSLYFTLKDVSTEGIPLKFNTFIE